MANGSSKAVSTKEVVAELEQIKKELTELAGTPQRDRMLSLLERQHHLLQLLQRQVVEVVAQSETGNRRGAPSSREKAPDQE